MINISFEKKRNKTFKRFSKKCITAMVVLWFIAVFVCIAVVAVQTVRGDMSINTGDLVTVVGIPMTGGVLGYMIKSAIEDNRKKENTHENRDFEETDKP